MRSARADLIVKMLVLIDDRPARRRNLNEENLPTPFRLQFKQPFDREKPFDDALRVIQAIDTDPDRVGQAPWHVVRGCVPDSPGRALVSSQRDGHSMEIG